jgi:tRNA-binding protein
MSAVSAYEAFNQGPACWQDRACRTQPRSQEAGVQDLDRFGEPGERTTSAQYTVLYQPEQLVGRSVVCAVNLGTRRIAGFKSEVLILCVEQSEGTVVYLTTERDVAPGTKVF